MAERINNLNEEQRNLLLHAWIQALPRQIDNQRSNESLRQALQGDDTAWYWGPGRSFLYLTDIVPGSHACFHALNLDGRRALQDIPFVRQTIKEIMAEHGLHRLTSYVPSPLGRVKRACTDIGFKLEGTLREAISYDTKRAHLDIYGCLFHELELRPTRVRKRRRRSNRKKHGNRKH